MHLSFQTLAMAGFIALVVIVGFFGPYVLSFLLIALVGLCWLFPGRHDDDISPPQSSGASKIGS